MSESITSQITFSKLLSHTFPGIFLTIGFFMLFHMLLSHIGIDDKYLIYIFADWKTLLAASGSLVFLGTIVGVIIDSFHHLIETEYIDKTWSAREVYLKRDEIFKDNGGNKVCIFYYFGFLSLDRFRYLINNYYSYVECELNLSISFFFSAFIYSIFLLNQGCKLIYVAPIFIFLLLLAHFCFWVGKKNYINFKKRQIDFIKGALDHEIKLTEKKQNSEYSP